MLAGSFVVAALALEMIKSMAFKSRGNHGEKQCLNADLLNSNMVGIQNSVVKALLTEPLTDRAWLWTSRNWRIFFGVFLWSWAHDSSGILTGSAVSSAGIGRPAPGFNAATWVSARR